ncbi:MAG: ParB/RepB/Spo0J family partition protein [Sulfurimicrobium sp.]|jgi:ParB family chromosome partitioning protein|nr:ParB/RepB/Spo0J family partition protein [Sulfurimicrobium sp.]MDO9190914.1 ParB/RepB/Spo0J family partition protein [Sulfurimicrobium sp.]MDP1704968.1 ParB/RepB/Spo0J family partition protein [Sulfurimicrobium sp.]MDP2198834.1 ParB/RepB/Spo0J family partition protein [Sulfurimicrobium sp.]MDP2963953.1 ParB/RepB/Spo0J family partition protein [Sulfurimicrobium sp.]
MTFKDTQPQFQMIDVTLIEPDRASPRRQIDEAALKGLANSIRKTGLIHPLVVQPANASGRHVLIVGERRWRAAVMAGEKTVPALIRRCEADEVLQVRVFENLGLGLRAPLEPRDMANAIQTIAERFGSREAAAEHLGGTPAWLRQATAAAAANLSPKITALLDSGKISSTGAAIQLEKLAQKNEAKAESLIGQIEQLPEGEKLVRKIVDRALSEEGGRRRKKEEALPAQNSSASDTLPWEEASAGPAAGRRINPGKVRMVAEILGLADGDEDEVLARLVDEFLALKGSDNPPF